MAKQPTLFSFFKKDKADVPGKSPAPLKLKNNTGTSEAKKYILKGKEINSFDLVWAKLDGYPWWPALVYKNSKEKSFFRNKQIHVQFFDDPPTRGWVKESFVKPYGDPAECGLPTYKDPLWVIAKQTADSAISLSINERSDLILEMASSDNENTEVESDSFNDSGSSKENVSQNENHRKRSDFMGKNDSEPTSKKRRLILLSDSESSEDEYKPGKTDHSSDDDDDSVSSGVAENEVSEQETESESGTPVKEVKPLFKNLSTPVLSKIVSNSKISELQDSTKAKLAIFSAKETPTKASEIVETTKDWPHNKYSFLKRENLKDAMKHSSDHPEYDPKTIFVPDDFLSKQTPGMRQWWEIKSKHFDTVLFFKMGKFYELFHMDAIISIQELGLLMMKGGENAHVGFPEISYGRYSATLIKRGYKVARVEQTETPEMMEKRCKTILHPSKFDRVVRRELCQVSSLGTRVPSVMDGEFNDTSSSYLLAICESIKDSTKDISEFGVAFIDTSNGTFHVGQFVDDNHLSRLRMLMAHYPPSQILVERGKISPKTLLLVKSAVPLNLLEYLSPEKEFWTASKTLSVLADSDYLKVNNVLEWPENLKIMISEDDLQHTANSKFELGVSSLGSIIWYLTLCKLEEDLISRKLFEIYSPPDCMNERNDAGPHSIQKHMVVDSATLKNLEIFQNSSNGSIDGTLFESLDNCQTPFGKRLLHNWICAPLCTKEAINSRLDAIADLRKQPEIVESIKPLLRSLPDFEKILSKIHSQGLKHSELHPDSRAIFYENQQYSQRKVQDFLSAVNGFKISLSIIESFKDVLDSLSSQLLKHCVSLQDNGGNFPVLKDVLKFFENAFDHSLASKEGKIIPSRGVDHDYDEALEKITELNQELNNYLKEQCKFFSCKVTFWGNDKKRYQLEVPDHAAKSINDEYELVSQKKGYKRYWTAKTKSLLNEMVSVDEQKEAVLKDISRRIFKQFDEYSGKWKCALECISVLDVLLSFTSYSLQVETTRPVINSASSEVKPFINIREGRHPCSIKIFNGSDYIPNDIVVGTSDEDSHAHLVLVTGPNMGGKSTLMRQTALICLIAQLGCYVPASECHLTPVDRIFTRLGAFDKIYQGESTFFVEMAETASFIHHATQNSLVIVDELGRGTATYDGTAIAFAVIESLSKVGCRTLFSTHYHSLVDDFKNFKGISLGHMACMVEDENEENPSQETITFLYKFAPGACPKSYGFNAARLAELPEKVVSHAYEKALQLEKVTAKKKDFRLLFGELPVKEKSTRTAIIELRNLFS